MVRKALFAKGFRFRLHCKELSGKPDIVFPKYRAAVFVHGCFWHGHNCHLFKWPKTRSEFWREKIGKNRKNDELALANLADADWRVLILWECALKGKERRDFDEIIDQVTDWLLGDTRVFEIRGLTTS